MSFGALSEEAKMALARGAELAGTGICSGEGGMLPEEQAANSRYFYELTSARFGFSWDKVQRTQAFHFKGGQGAKTGTGGHLPGDKVKGRIAEVRGLPEGQPAISPARFPEWTSLTQFRDFAAEVREKTGGIPVGFKLSAQHIEKDIDVALEVGVDYIILDGRGGGTGAAPLIFRDHISVPTIPALARARRHLDRCDAAGTTLIITGGLRHPADFAKAIALGANGVAVSNAAIQAIGCVGMRACHTNNCPVGIATQKPHLRDRLPVDIASERLARFFTAAVDLFVGILLVLGVLPGNLLARQPRQDQIEMMWPVGRVKTVTAGTHSFALTNIDGQFTAMDNRCPHQGGPLGEGSIEVGNDGQCWLRLSVARLGF